MNWEELALSLTGPCAYLYHKGGVPRPDLQCPNHPYFAINIPDGRGGDWRKGRLACVEHLPDVIWQMKRDHGGYQGEYQLLAGDWEHRTMSDEISLSGTESVPEICGAVANVVRDRVPSGRPHAETVLEVARYLREKILSGGLVVPATEVMAVYHFADWQLNGRK